MVLEVLVKLGIGTAVQSQESMQLMTSQKNTCCLGLGLGIGYTTGTAY